VLVHKIHHGDIVCVGDKELETLQNSTKIAEKWILEIEHINNNWHTVKFIKCGRKNEPDIDVCVAVGGVDNLGAWLTLTPEGIQELK
jgi:hypothetical protein